MSLKPDEKKEVAEIAGDKGGNAGANVAIAAVTRRQEQRERFTNTANKVLYLLLPVLVAIIVILIFQNNFTESRSSLNDTRFTNLQKGVDEANRKLDALNTSD